MRTIRQVEWGGTETLELAEAPAPKPAPTEVLVKVVAAGVNPVDVYTRMGVAYNRVLRLPFVNGWDVAGVVTEVGYGVTRFKPGDRVFGMPWFPREAGAYAEYLTAPSRHLAMMPKDMSFAEAAALPLAGLTAWQTLVDVAGVGPGQRVLISAAAGGVGHLAVQVAKACGAHVIGTASEVKHEFVRALGADEVVDYTTTEVAETVKIVDVVIQMFGGQAALRAMECLRPGGIMVNAQAAWTPDMPKRAEELGVHSTAYLVEPDSAGLEALVDLYLHDRLLVHVSQTFPLADAAIAHEVIAQGHTTGKVILTVADAE